jgi:FG-GAP repeat
VSYSQTPAIDLPLAVRTRTSRSGRSLLRLTLALVTVAVLGGIAVVVESYGHARRETGSPSSHHAQASLPAAATLAVSRELGAHLAGYRLARSPHGFLARDARQGITASFDAQGATVTARDGAHASIALQAIGFGHALAHEARLARPLARGNRVEYRRSMATEWFANGPAGIEQGFTVRGPAGAAAGALTLALGVSGTLTARPGAGGGLVLAGTGGKAVLRYGDLSVTDARGKSLPAHMTAGHGRVLISVDARGARYPLTVDPLLSQVAELYASDGEKEDQLGGAIAASGSTVVVGESLDTVAGHLRAGAAYVFIEGAGGWATATQVAKLIASSSEEEEALGASVAISGKTIVVGAPGRKSGSGVDAGGAYVYSEPAGGWGEKAEQTEAAELYNSEDVALYSFGTSVAISGETIVVGTPFYRDYVQNLTSPPRDGAAFVFQEPAGGWASEPHHPEYQTATLVPHEAEVEDLGHFGQSVAIGTDGGEQSVVVGAPVEPVGTEPDKYQHGIVFIFSRPAGGWGISGERFPQARLTASDGSEFANLGESVSLSGDVLAAGAPRAEVASVKQGATYIFTAPPGGWGSEPEQSDVAKLTTPGGIEGDQYGESVALEGDTVVSTGAGRNAFLFAMPSSGWSGEIDPSSEFAGKIYAAGIDGGEALLGALTAKPPGGAGGVNQGAVDVVPFAPLVSTSGTSGLTEVAATIEGTVNPDQTTLSSCHFQYGTSSSYGQEVPCSSFPTTGIASSAVSVALAGLASDTTYHYRVIATNEVDTSYGSDATFTTAAAAGTGKSPESPPPPSTATTTSTTSTPATTTPATTSTPATTPTTIATTTAPSPILACTTAQVALVNVIRQGSRVQITGAARLVLAGKRVSIRLLATRKIVATAMIAPNGTFSVTAALPPAKIRETNLARYEAIVGSLHSLNLKLARRMYMVSATRTGTHVRLDGYVTGSFKAGSPVKILLRVTCSKEEVVAKVKLTRAGKFTATVPAPTGAASQVAVYRATTTVLDGGHPETTYTLPTPPSG